MTEVVTDIMVINISLYYSKGVACQWFLPIQNSQTGEENDRYRDDGDNEGAEVGLC